jgi:hypothetical protein
MVENEDKADSTKPDTSESKLDLLKLWEKPLVRYLVGAVAAVAGIGKILQILYNPDASGAVKALLWVVIALTLLPLGFYYGRRFVCPERQTDERYRSEMMPPPDSEMVRKVAYEVNSILYGFGYEDLAAHCTIRSDGSAAFRREVQLRAQSPVHKLEVYMLLPEASEDGESVVNLDSVTSLTRFKRIEHEVTRSSSGNIYLTLNIIPGVTPDDPLFEYEVSEHGSAGLYALHGEKDRKMDYDYFAWDISRPTRKLRMKVLFPEGVQPLRSYHDVWHALGQAESTFEQEHDRVKELLKEGKEGAFYTLTFEVPYPILGLTYVICWRPPKGPDNAA